MTDGKRIPENKTKDSIWYNITENITLAQYPHYEGERHESLNAHFSQSVIETTVRHHEKSRETNHPFVSISIEDEITIFLSAQQFVMLRQQIESIKL